MSIRATIRSGNTRELEALLVGLALQSWVQLTSPTYRGRIPELYSGHYRYLREPGREEWQSAAENALRGYGDCEDLACHRVAELWRQGVRAMPKIIEVNPMLRHVVVQLPNGQIEDPSKKLGM